MNFHSNILPFDIFFADKKCDFEDNFKHYYVCIYSQQLDQSHRVLNDLYGLIITTNKKYEYIQDDYVVPIVINERKCYVCCDKLVRIKLDEKVQLKQYYLTEEQKEQVRVKTVKFMQEVKRQIWGGIDL